MYLFLKENVYKFSCVIYISVHIYIHKYNLYLYYHIYKDNIYYHIYKSYMIYIYNIVQLNKKTEKFTFQNALVFLFC